MKVLLNFIKRKKFYLGSAILLSLVIVAGIVYAAFADKGKILGSNFSVGSSDIKLLVDVSAGTGTENLSDELTGPAFVGISPNWQEDYLMKIFNNGTSDVDLSSNANYETANDPDELRQIIFVEPFEWDDLNNDGLVDSGEEGASLGRKTIIKWKTEGYALGQLGQGEVKGLILRFSTDSVSDTKQGKSGVFDFEFDSIEVTP